MTVAGWKSQLDMAHPCWRGYRGLLGRLPEAAFPQPFALCGLLPSGLSSHGGATLRFVAASALPGVEYERHVYEHGEVSTRAESWHDLFNALVWCRLPRLKAAMNAVHFRHLSEAGGGRRGPVRDALTLLDESGVIVCATDERLLKAVHGRDWAQAFQARRGSWSESAQVLVSGHAILEKFLHPYKSITAHALLVHSPGPLDYADIDGLLSASLLAGELLESPADLSPLPLMGIPGWWTGGPQDAAFYADRHVFRPRRPSG